jgi:hypothetical protein
MSNPWFRLYAEFAHDPKVQMMPEAMQRRLVMLMCMRCSNVTVTLRDDEIAFQLRISESDLAETKRLFIAKGFVDSDWKILNWEKRQFASDHDPSGAERQKRYREKQKELKAVTLRNAQVTLPDTDTDTDTDIEPKGSLSPSAPEQSPVDQKPEKPAKPEKQEIACPHEALIDLYAEHLPNLPQPRRSLWPKSAAAKAMQERWRWVMSACHESGQRKGQRMATTESEGLDWFGRYFAYVAESDFLTGRSGKFTSCDLGWLVTLANFTKVLQGNYHVEKVAA